MQHKSLPPRGNDGRWRTKTLGLTILETPLATDEEVIRSRLRPARQVRLIPLLCVFFALARFVYWWGYLRGDTLGRAPGVQFTFLLNIWLLVMVLVRFATSLLA